MIKKRIMIVGAAKSGKSTLANIINKCERPIRCTQDIIYGKYTIDTPSVYLELPFNYKFLVATAQEASVLVCILDATNPMNHFPPLFAESFNCYRYGVISKIDKANKRQIEKAEKQMQGIGITSNLMKCNLEKWAQGKAIEDDEIWLDEIRGLCRI